VKINSYCKIYNLGHAAIKDLFLDDVQVEEKIDGSQFSWALIDGDLNIRSRGKELFINQPEKMFSQAIAYILSIKDKLQDGLIYRGEYLKTPKHNTLAYDRIPKNHIIIFDINNGIENYLSYEDKVIEAEKIGLECVPLLYRGRVDNYEQFKTYLEKTSILGGQKIEGVVIKNYNRFGKDGKVLMGKYVSEQFKEIHQKSWKDKNPKNKDIIKLIGESLKTDARWNKAIQHLKDRGELTNSVKDIGNLIKELHADILEECEEYIKKVLFDWGWKHIIRIISSGFPEYYKDLLAKEQFKK